MYLVPVVRALVQIPLMQAMSAPHLRCSVDLKTGSVLLISTTNSLMAGSLKCQQTVWADSKGSYELSEPSSESSISHWAAVRAVSTPKLAGPVARVEDSRIFSDGFHCQPAVADNSMHIGILTGTPDSLSRVPGTVVS